MDLLSLNWNLKSVPALENNKVVTYFYKFIELKQEKAEDQLNALLGAFETDGIYEAIKRRVIVSLVA